MSDEDMVQKVYREKEFKGGYYIGKVTMSHQYARQRKFLFEEKEGVLMYENFMDITYTYIK